MADEPTPIRPSHIALVPDRYTGEPRFPDLTLENVLQALQENIGNISACCRYLGKGRSQLMDFIHRHPELAVALADIRSAIVDQAETNVYKAIMAGDKDVSLRVLPMLGQDRGWQVKRAGEAEEDTSLPTIIIQRALPKPEASNG